MESQKIRLESIDLSRNPQVRIIPKLEVKVPNLIKGIQLEGLRKIGDPNEYATKYYIDGADEIYFEDVVASLHGQNRLMKITDEATKSIFIPISVGGGLKTVGDVSSVLRAGADKVSINTAAVRNPSIISSITSLFGAQCLTVSIQAKITESGWEVYTDNGRERTGLNAIDWAQKVQDLGAGEILVTSVDRDGTLKGLDLDLIGSMRSNLEIPLIASGGVGCLDDVAEAVIETGIDGIAIAGALHRGIFSIWDVKERLMGLGVPVRFESKIEES